LLTLHEPTPPGVDTDFDRHEEIFLASYLWAREAIAALEAEGNQAIAAILATADPGNKTVLPSGGVSFDAVFS
jgi:NTE family protein